MHYSFMSTNLHWSTVALTSEQYLDFWLKSIGQIRQVQRDSPGGFKSIFDRHLEVGLVSSIEVPKLDEYFTRTNRQHINVCPGFSLWFRWALIEAEQLDGNGRFAKAVNQRLGEALGTWGQDFE